MEIATSLSRRIAGNLVWHRLYREGSNGFTFPAALSAVILQCEEEERDCKRQQESPPDSTVAYRKALEAARAEYEAATTLARQQAEAALIATWRDRGNEYETIADALAHDAYDTLVF